VIGFSAIEKGNILHQALAFLWQHLQTQQQLLATDDDTLVLLVSDAVSNEIQTIIKHKRYHFGNEMIRLEAERQTELILKWLAYEKTRRPFTVKCIEESYRVNVKGYNLHLRLDRIDEVNPITTITEATTQLDSCRPKTFNLIIDYKSGQCSLSDWGGDHPNDPQLPFYLCINNLAANSFNNKQPNLGDEDFVGSFPNDSNVNSDTNHFSSLNAIAFGQINVKQQALIGLHHESYELSEITSIKNNKVKLQSTWEQASNEWSRVSFTLFEHFLLGHTNIQFSNANQLNFSRDLISLNRFYDTDVKKIQSKDK
jgi:hypothetical protein